MSKDSLTALTLGKNLIFPSIRRYQLQRKAGELALGRPVRVLKSFVLCQLTEGSLLLQMDGQPLELHAGDSLLLPPGTLLACHSPIHRPLCGQLLLFRCVELSRAGNQWEGVVPNWSMMGYMPNRHSQAPFSTSSPQQNRNEVEQQQTSMHQARIQENKLQQAGALQTRTQLAKTTRSQNNAISPDPLWCELAGDLFARFDQLSLFVRSRELAVILAAIFDYTLTMVQADTSRPMRQLTPQPDNNLWSMEQMLHYLQQHYMEDIRLASLAANAGLSPNHFARMFKRQTGMTPLKYITSLRIKHAKQLLFRSQKIKSIAEQVGYNDEHYFSRAFKKAEGISPLAYVKNRDHRIAALYYGLDDHLATLGYEPLTALSYRERVQLSHAPAHSAGSAGSAGVMRGSTSRVQLSSFQSNYEQLLRLKPDVLLTSDCMQNDEQLDRIAPTIIMAHSYQPLQTMRQIAGILGKERIAQEWIQRYEQQRSEHQASIRQLWGTPSACFIRVRSNCIRVYGGRHQMSSLLYDELGMVLPLSLPTIPRWVDVRLLPELWQILHKAEHLFLMVDRTAEASAMLQAMLSASEWMDLPAVLAQQVYNASDMLFTTLGPSGRLCAMNHIAELMGALPQATFKA